MAHRTTTILTDEQILDGYAKVVRHSIELIECSNACFPITPGVALGLSEIGQEELGKAYMLLCAADLPQNDAAQWKKFWWGWRRHDLKAHSAFFYEWFNPLRIQVTRRDGIALDGMPMRDPISAEKTVGLYVDFDPQTGDFRQPSERVFLEEASARIGSLIMLGNTALQLYKLIMQRDVAIRLHSLGALARELTERRVWQEEMPSLIDAMSTRSPEHAQLVEEFKRLLPWNWKPPTSGPVAGERPSP